MMGILTAKESDSLQERINKEFEKPFFRDWDKRFLAAFFLSLLVEVIIVTIMAQRPVSEYSEKDIGKIQEQFASFVLGKIPKEKKTVIASSQKEALPPGKTENESEKKGKGGGGKGSARGKMMSSESRLAARMSSAEARRKSREAISREVSNRGLLALLTGTGTAAKGEAVSTLFTEAGSGKGVNEDLDRVLSSVNGLKTQGKSGLGLDGTGGGNVRGGRSGKKASINDLVSDLSDASSQSLSRKGQLKFETPAEVVGRGRRSVYRSPEAIQEVLLSHVPAIRYCYERELKRNPTLKGKLVVRITVGPDGRVKNASILSSTLNNDSVERCILTRIRLWRDFKPIDPSEGDVTFRQTYTFGY